MLHDNITVESVTKDNSYIETMKKNTNLSQHNNQDIPSILDDDSTEKAENKDRGMTEKIQT